MHFFIDFVRNRVPFGWKQNSSGWITGNCPMCVDNGEGRPDTKQRGGFQFQEHSWRYNCFNCHYTASWEEGTSISWRSKKLLKNLGCDEAEVQRASLELLREEETAKFLKPESKPEQAYKPRWPEIKLPDGSVSILDNNTQFPNRFYFGIEMLHERDLLHHTDWFYTPKDFKYKQRMILPYRYNGKIVGY